MTMHDEQVYDRHDQRYSTKFDQYLRDSTFQCDVERCKIEINVWDLLHQAKIQTQMFEIMSKNACPRRLFNCCFVSILDANSDTDLKSMMSKPQGPRHNLGVCV